jgi:hypothetical protein
MPESLLVNYMEFANVGHVIEALRYALAYHAANPSREIGVLLPSNSPWELAAFCPFVHGVYPVSPRLSDLPGSLEGSARMGLDRRQPAPSRPGPRGCLGRSRSLVRNHRRRTQRAAGARRGRGRAAQLHTSSAAQARAAHAGA